MTSSLNLSICRPLPAITILYRTLPFEALQFNPPDTGACIQYDQGDEPLHLFFEEPVIKDFKPEKVIVTSDQFSSYMAWRELNAYDLGTGLLFPGAENDVVAIPLKENVLYDLGYVTILNAALSDAASYMIDQIRICLPKSF